mmetsp:Transcript_42043/g.64427  ORF Transcript_42043/g.64427 Transcript_42043/m.64427 type:complete len:121 (-) Transcript_42043:1181-1543(-)
MQSGSPSKGSSSSKVAAELTFPLNKRGSFLAPGLSANLQQKASPVKVPVEVISDEEIYKNFVLFLLSYDNGTFLNSEILGHFEYFIQTLSLDMKSRLENPFEFPENYPAFDFRVSENIAS